MFVQAVVTGFLLGLSASPSCLGVCLPVLLPHIGVVGGERPVRAGFSTSILFALGRLIIYLGLGTALFILGTTLKEANLWKNTPWLNISRYVLAVLVILYGISVVFDWPKLTWCRALFHGRSQRPFLSVLLGALVGSILCPALWLAFFQGAQVAWLPQAWLSITSFWLGSSLIIIAVGVSAGAVLKYWRNFPQVRSMAGATLILVGFLYLIKG